VDAWLAHLGAGGLSAATIGGYRRDVEGMAVRIAPRSKGVQAPQAMQGVQATQAGNGVQATRAGNGVQATQAGNGVQATQAGNGVQATQAGDVARLRLGDLSKAVICAAFESWAADHATASVLRAHSAWLSFFDFLVTADALDGNPMAVVAKPKRPPAMARAIRDPDAAARLLATAAVADGRSRAPWPERDVALVATFCVTGIRAGEAVGLDLASLTGTPGVDRRLAVSGSDGRARSIPVHDPLEAALGDYLTSRSARFPDLALDEPSAALFVDARGRRLSADQVKYLIERLYVRAGLRARVPAGALVHALRHTFAVSAIKAGADLLELQTLLGHASLDATRRYLDATADDLRTVTAVHPGHVALERHLRSRARPG